MSNPSLVIPGKLIDQLRDTEGLFSVAYENGNDFDTRWTAWFYLGKEGPEEEKVEHGHGSGPTAADAVGEAIKDLEK